MFFRTHLLITIFFALLIFPVLNDKILFLAVSIIATAIPDIDSRFSKLGKMKILRFLQFFTKHRGIIHSFTFLFFISIILIVFFRETAFPFAFGYSLHLITDGFTLTGIKPFYPLKTKMKGQIKTGGIAETIIFVCFLLGDLFLIFIRFFSIL